jgi:hypothetical protein
MKFLLPVLALSLASAAQAVEVEYFVGGQLGGGRMQLDSPNTVFANDTTRSSKDGVFTLGTFAGARLQSAHNIRLRTSLSETTDFLGLDDQASLIALDLQYFYELHLGEHFAIAPGVGLSRWTFTTDSGSETFNGKNERPELDESGVDVNYSVQLLWNLNSVQMGLEHAVQPFDFGDLKQTVVNIRVFF